MPEFIPDAEFKGLDLQNGYIKVILFYDYESDWNGETESQVCRNKLVSQNSF